MPRITVEIKEEVWHDPIEDAELVILKYQNPQELQIAAHEGVTDVGLWRKEAEIAVPLHVHSLVEYLIQRREILTGEAIVKLLCHSKTVLPILEEVQAAIDREFCQDESDLNLPVEGGEQQQ